jgi:glycosyltransferase involved in cell wall biosynthesis
MRWQMRESIGDEPTGIRERAIERVHDHLEAAPVRRSTLLLASTTAHADQVLERLGEAKPLEITPLGTAPPPAAVPRPDASKSLRFLFVGRLEARKGADVLLEAFDRYVEADGPAAELVLCGADSMDPNGGPSFFEAALAPLSQRSRMAIHMLGYRSDTELTALYDSADVFVAPSRFESFGLIIAEAMGHGVPVIATTAGGIPEVVSHARDGLLVPPSDAGALANALLQLARDRTLRKVMGDAARAKWIAKYSQRAMAERSLRAYERAISLSESCPD